MQTLRVWKLTILFGAITIPAPMGLTVRQSVGVRSTRLCLLYHIKRLEITRPASPAHYDISFKHIIKQDVKRLAEICTTEVEPHLNEAYKAVM